VRITIRPLGTRVERGETVVGLRVEGLTTRTGRDEVWLGVQDKLHLNMEATERSVGRRHRGTHVPRVRAHKDHSGI
jgi:hypothetical protein